MTNRVHSLTVVLDKDYREDDVQSLMDAIMHIKGVIGVANNIANIDSYVAQQRAKTELGNKIIDVIYPKEKDHD